MSFTIKCNECGNEQVFSSDSSRFGDNIEIDVDTYNSYEGSIVKAIAIYCENISCPNQIEVKM